MLEFPNDDSIMECSRSYLPLLQIHVRRILEIVSKLGIWCLLETKVVGLILKMALRVIWPNVVASFTNHVEGKGAIATMVSSK
jgi:hypothetical protein